MDQKTAVLALVIALFLLFSGIGFGISTKITSPPDGSTQFVPFTIMVDDPVNTICSYSVKSNGKYTKNDYRTCDEPITISSSICTRGKACEVEVSAEDENGKISSDSRTYQIDYCGDGTKQSEKGEQCDDGNNDDFDGCSAACQSEPPFVVTDVKYCMSWVAGGQPKCSAPEGYKKVGGGWDNFNGAGMDHAVYVKVMEQSDLKEGSDVITDAYYCMLYNGPDGTDRKCTIEKLKSSGKIAGDGWQPYESSFWNGKTKYEHMLFIKKEKFGKEMVVVTSAKFCMSWVGGGYQPCDSDNRFNGMTKVGNSGEGGHSRIDYGFYIKKEIPTVPCTINSVDIDTSKCSVADPSDPAKKLCLPGDKIGLSAKYTGTSCPTPIDLIVSGGSQDQQCIINTINDNTIYGMKVTMTSSGQKLSWTIPDTIPESCKGKTVTFATAQLKDSDGNAVSNSLSLTGNQITFPSDVTGPGIVISLVPASPKPGDNIIFRATATDANKVKSVKIIINDTAKFPTTLPDEMIKTCTSRNSAGDDLLTCTRSLNSNDLTHDYTMTIKAIAYDMIGNKAEETIPLKIITGRKLKTHVKEIWSTDSDKKTTPPYYLDSDAVLIAVGANLVDKDDKPVSAQLTGLHCMFSKNNRSYSEMSSNLPAGLSEECTDKSEAGPICPTPYDTDYCESKDIRKKCNVYISCANILADKTSVYEQTKDNNMNVTWIIGTDTDPPAVEIVRPGESETILSLRKVEVEATTDEPASCRWDKEANGYNDMPSASVNGMESSDKRTHKASVSLSSLGADPSDANKKIIYVSCKDEKTPPNVMTNSVKRSFFFTDAEIIITAFPASIEANNKAESAITASIVDERGGDVPGNYRVNFAVTARPTTAKPSFDKTVRKTATSCDTSNAASCSVKLYVDSKSPGTATVTATSGEERATVDVLFTEPKPLSVKLEAEPPSTTLGDEIKIIASVLTSTGDIDREPRRITFAVVGTNKDKVSLSSESCETSRGTCSITAETAEDTTVTATVKGSSESATQVIKPGQVAIEFRKIECDNRLCELPAESGSCAADCGNVDTLVTDYAEYPALDPYGLKFSSTLAPDDIAVERAYYICKDGTSVSECMSETAGIGKKTICVEEYDASAMINFRSYECVVTCSNSETGFYYPLIVKKMASGKDMKFTGAADRYTCPSIPGSSDLSAWLDRFNTLKDLIVSLESLRKATLNYPAISAADRAKYERYEINLKEAGIIVDSHISYLKDVMKQPSAKSINDANTLSATRYGAVMEMLNDEYVVPAVIIKSITSPEFITTSTSKFVKTGTTLNIAVSAENKGDARKGIVRCEFKDPSGDYETASSSCMDMPKGTKTFSLAKAVSELGVWDMSCTISAGPSCSSTIDRHKKTESFEVVSSRIGLDILSPKQSAVLRGTANVRVSTTETAQTVVKAAIGKDAACSSATFAEMVNVKAAGEPTDKYDAFIDTTTVTSDTGDGDYYICVSAELRGFDKALKSIRVKIKNYDFEWPSMLAGSSPAGQSITYNAVLRNIGGIDDIYDITVSNDKNWDTSSDRSQINVDAGSSGLVEITVSVPDGVESSTTTVTATSRFGKETKTLKIVTHTDAANRPPGISGIKAEPDPVEFGQNVKFSASIGDRDGDLVTAEVCRDKDCAGKYCESMVQSGSVYSCTYLTDKGKDKTGTNEFFVHAKDTKSPRGEAVVGSAFQIAAPADSPTVTLSPKSQAGDAGATLTYVISVFNPSSASVPFAISVTKPSAIIDVTATKTITVDANSAKDDQIKLKSSTNAAPGTYTFTVKVSSGNLIGSDTGEYVVTAPNAPVLSASPESASGQPGETVIYDVRVTNRDSQARTIHIAASAPSGWTSRLSKADIDLGASESKDLTLEVTSPLAAEIKEHIITVRASFANAVATQAVTYSVMPKLHIGLSAPQQLSMEESATLTASVLNQSNKPVQAATSIAVTFEKTSDSGNTATLSAGSCTVPAGAFNCSVAMSSTGVTIAAVKASASKMGTDTKTITFAPAVTILVYPQSPSVADNQNGIYFTGQSGASNLESIILYADGAQIGRCDRPSPSPCTASKTSLPLDKNIEYYAAAVVGAIRGESQRKSFLVPSGNKIVTKVDEISGDADAPFYAAQETVFVKVSGKLLNQPVQNMVCRWDPESRGYATARNRCSPGTQSICQIPQGAHCTAAGGRNTCRIYVACSDRTEFYNQTADNNLAVAWTVGEDNDPPAVTIASPAPGSIATTSVLLNAMTDEPATCRWSREAKGYNEMPSVTANAMASTDRKNHTATLTASALALGENTLYVSCQDRTPARNNMTTAAAVAFTFALPGSFTITPIPPAFTAPATISVGYIIRVASTDTAGSQQTTITLAATGPANWTVSLNRSYVTLSPGESSDVLLNVTSTFRTAVGNYTINLTGRSVTMERNVTINHSIGTSGYLSINSISLTPNTTIGGVAYVTLNVSNVGDINYWGYDVCSIKSPANAVTPLRSGCVRFDVNSTGLIVSNFTPTMTGLWNVTSCSLYASFDPTCSTILQGSVPGGVVSVTLPPDSDKPVTTILCDGAECETSYTRNVGITFSCADSGTGCSATRYCVDKQNKCTPTAVYNMSVSIPLSGTNYIRYYSKDMAGNTEDVKSKLVNIFNYVCGDNVCESGEPCAEDCVSTFSSVSYETTERGVRFSAALAPSLPAARFIACNSTSSYTACKTDYESGKCGPGGKCLCGWFSFEQGCEVRCGDTTDTYYAIGYQSVGQQKVIVSGINSYTCPVLNLDVLENYVSIFELYSTSVANQLKITTIQDSYRQVLEEVKLLADSQANYLKSVLSDVTVTKSAEAIKKSQDTEEEIKNLLSSAGNFQRAINITDVGIGASVIKGRNISLTITSNEGVWRYGLATCQFTRPNGAQAETKTACVQLPPGAATRTNTNVVLDTTGNWTFRSCRLNITVLSNCTPSILYSTYENARQFEVRDARALTMKASLPYSNVTLGKKAVVTVEINNTDDLVRNAIASCTFVKPSGAKATNSSPCVTLLPFARVLVAPYTIADSIGSWSVESCSLQESNNNTCAPAWPSDTKSSIGSFSVSAERAMSIVGAAAASEQVEIGERQAINIITRNEGNTTARAFVNCTLTDPDSVERYAGSQQQDVAPRSNSAFDTAIAIDKEGTWTLESCSVIRVIDNNLIKEDEEIIGGIFDAVSIECTSNSQCGGTTVSCRCVDSKCKPCDYGYVCRNSACVAERTEEDCLGTKESCYKRGTMCVACADNEVCAGSQCAPINDEPVPSVPMFTIIVILLAVLTPVIVFLVYRTAISRR